MSPSPFHGDEPTLEDSLGHASHVEEVARMIENFEPPYVLGIHGDWGSGKTSFLCKLRLYLAGKSSGYRHADALGKALWPETYNGKARYETLWFEAWRYQFEANPVVALLNEIRSHFTWSRRLTGQAAKASFAALMSIEDVTRKLGIQPSKIVAGGENWEAQSLAQALPSQRCRDLLEEAIGKLLSARSKRHRRLVIFIDDLDRCQGQMAFRLLEALKIYLSIPSCSFVLGLDVRNVLRAVGAELRETGLVPEGGPHDSAAGESHRQAAAYLDKLFQSVYHLPTVARPVDYLNRLLAANGSTGDHARWDEILLDSHILAPNPRKIKAFLNGLTLYLQQLRPRLAERELKLDPKLALIITYLYLEENDLYRILETRPDFWRPLVRFCRDGEPQGIEALADLKLSERPQGTAEHGYTYESLYPDPADPRLFRVAPLLREWRGGGVPTKEELEAYFLRPRPRDPAP